MKLPGLSEFSWRDVATEARLRAGMPESFLAALAAYVPERKGRPVLAPHHDD